MILPVLECWWKFLYKAGNLSFLALFLPRDYDVNVQAENLEEKFQWPPQSGAKLMVKTYESGFPPSPNLDKVALSLDKLNNTDIFEPLLL